MSNVKNFTYTCVHKLYIKKKKTKVSTSYFFFSFFHRLVVTAPLHVEVNPSLLSVHLGGGAEFRCDISSHPQAGPHFVTWYKDGRQLPGTGRQSEVLRINSIGREDRGMYQCIVRRSEGDTAQAAAELQLGGELSPLFFFQLDCSFFFDQKLNFKASKVKLR